MTQETPKNKEVKGKRVIILVLLLVLAFLAGIAGELFTKVYLSKVSFFRDFYFTEQSNLGDNQIIISEPKKVVIQQDLRINQLQNEIKPAVFGIYKERKTSKDILDKLILPSDYLGQAVVLTSDGWLISSDSVLIAAKDKVAISNDKKIYAIDKVIHDEASKLVFLKISAQNLVVNKLADFNELTAGVQAVVYNSYLEQIDLVNIKNKNYQNISDKYSQVNSSQLLNKRILVSKAFDANFMAAPLYNFEGQLLGLMTGIDNNLQSAIPIYYIQNIVSQVLKDEDIKRPYLGINYLNLERVFGLLPEDRQNADSGALIWPNDKGLAITTNSPLYKKLKTGDIIVSLENQKIVGTNDLAEILLQYKNGQEVNMKYLRDGQSNEIVVKLE